MPFSSYVASNNRRGGWAHSLLPSITTRSKHPSSSSRKSRRRTALIGFLFTNLFTIALSVSLLFFFLTLFLFGIPTPLHFTSNLKPHTSRFMKPRNRKPPVLDRPRENGGVLGALVDLTTKDLYDKIEFRDVDGGPWTQGWRVGYKGDEWDSERLKVFVVPHSHNDPGWKLTVDEYYERQSRHILDTIVDTLSKDVRRKFIWEEMSYLERWWRDASENKRESFTSLVKTGQLEIVGGGWVMNDEANSHYFAIIEQITEGNMWLNETLGVIPKNSWAIDPFGYSSTMAYILRRMGFENMLIQRTHYELKKELALSKNLEYIWRQSWDAEETTDIFVHMMPFYSYDIPHTCGPEPAICCQFDFARMRGSTYELCPWGEHPVETNQENVQERALKLLDQYRKKSKLYRTNTLLVPLGDDFRYISTDEAEAQFRNYQLIFDNINSNPNLNVEAKFGTLDDYFRTLREEADRVNYSVPGEVGSGLVGGFPSLSGDFFTYADRQQDYWSGYYVSRPFFKAVDRVLEHTLRASEMMMALLLGYCQRAQCEKLPMGFAYKLTAARRNLALFQHHDGVTGTAKDHVVKDYGSRMHTSLQDLQIFMSKAIELLLGIRHEKSDQSPSEFEPEQVRSKYDVQPVHKSISVREGTAQSVVFFNPLEQTREEIVMVIVNRPDVTVLGLNWTCVPSQVSPEMQHDKSKIFTGRHRLHWKASVPALGLQTYYIASGFVGCEKAQLANLRYLSKSNQFICPPPYTCSKIVGDAAEIQNRHQTLTFDVKHGLLRKISHKNGSEMIVAEEIAMYSSSGSGAYLFKPDGDAQSIIEASGHTVISEGPLMLEVYSYPKTAWDHTPISHCTRIYNGDNTIQEFLVEKEYHVELLGEDFNDKELIARYKTDTDNKRIFYSDLNGFQMSRRETYDKIPLQGNYYPMPSLSFMQGSKGQRFSVHSRQSLGVASLEHGWLEIMLDRRLPRDDGRGLGQGVMDNRAMNVVFHILLESNISSTLNPVSNPLPRSPSLLSHLVGAHLNYPLHVFIAKKPQDISPQPVPRIFSPLAAPLPCDLHIVNFKVPRPLKYSQLAPEDSRFILTLQRYHWDSSYCRKARSQCMSVADEPINLYTMFKGLSVLNARATSLNLLHEDMEILGFTEPIGDVAQEGHVIISPMEIQAYRLALHPELLLQNTDATAVRHVDAD
ncbi:Glyco_hydro_38 domain-containing protein/Glyco_hydro_38C domain-containing protein/Alpha-mann_mid domain-containing protein [Cephalotus follicularis]|uniref:Alpha-mannosidase n=1 Tax=Cephalotus follicularis TaxID=3775 RepID=A0A1Q3CL58_CEPFO|nr:Glyco_hydro_38 domain-containing protein/Glyco_hydro_38C domain-containing protein/Alpha-mann_mid domain-containing protein [Cephalotus follicularis]